MKERLVQQYRIHIINLYYEMLRNCHGVEKEINQVLELFVEFDFDLIIKDPKFYNADTDTSGLSSIIKDFDMIRRNKKLDKLLKKS